MMLLNSFNKFMYFFEFGLLEYILFIFEMIANCDSYELDVAFNLLGV